MDFSAANQALWNIIIQLGIIAGAIMVSNGLIRSFKWFRNTLLPTSVLAGFLLLILKSLHILKLDDNFLEILVYHCIALGFIAMSLRAVNKSAARNSSLTGPKSGSIIVGTYLIQGVTGLVITILLAYTVMPSMFKAAGLLLPMGFGQGPGQANNVGTTYQGMGFAGGRSFGLAIAATGYICACTVGVIMVNILAKKNPNRQPRKQSSEELSVGFFQDHNEIPVSDSIDKLSVQLAMVLLTYLATFLLLRGLTGLFSSISEGLANTLNPLFWGFNFIFGSALAMLVRVCLDKAMKMKVLEQQYQNNYLLNRLSGFFFDIMIVAGIASINIQDLRGLWLPFVLMVIAGGIVTWFYLKYVCKKAFPDYYDEGLISMYGMLTGTIGSGILLLREIDPDYSTPAANNLVVGSSYGIVLGAPVLILVGLAPKSNAMCFVTLGLAAVYWALLTLFTVKAKRKNK